MKIQSLAIIFIIVILPISIVLTSYTQSRVQTLSLQARYDSKLIDATYDALKAYQINSLNNSSSDYVNSKMRDIKASVNTFFNTMASGFSTLGYSKETIQNYVPAIVYTMYDGYYIYSPYKNTWDEETKNKVKQEEEQYTEQGITYTPSFSSDENLYGLKPYIYYSCRYKRGEKFDITITYSLDNYIQIQGYVTEGNKKKTVSKSGYVLSNVNVNGDNVTYKNISINTEQNLRENISFINLNGVYTETNLKFIKRNGVKYYLDETNNKVFSIMNGKAILQTGISASEINNNNNAKEYYKKAKEIENFIKTYLSDLSTNDIVDTTGNNYYSVSGKIFDFDHNRWNRI